MTPPEERTEREVAAARSCRDRPGRYIGQFRPEFSRLHEDPDLLWVAPLPVRYVICVVGRRLAGRSTVLSWLADKRGFETHSLAALVRREAERCGRPPGGRANLQDLGDELRADFGSAVLGQRMFRLLRRRHLQHEPPVHHGARIAISGFKHPAELEVFLSFERVRVVLLDARQDIRFKRARQTGMAAELAEAGHDPADLSLKAFQDCIDMRDRDGRSFFEWAPGSAQAVDRVMSRAYRERRDHPALVKIITNNGEDDQELYSDLADYADELDVTFRTPAV